MAQSQVPARDVWAGMQGQKKNHRDDPLHHPGGESITFKDVRTISFGVSGPQVNFPLPGLLHRLAEAFEHIVVDDYFPVHVFGQIISGLDH